MAKNNKVIRFSGIVVCTAILLFITTIEVQAADSRSPELKIYSGDAGYINSFYAFAENFSGGASVATCDLEGNG